MTDRQKAEEMIRRAEQQGCHLSAQQVKDIGKKVAAEINNIPIYPSFFAN